LAAGPKLMEALRLRGIEKAVMEPMPLEPDATFQN